MTEESNFRGEETDIVDKDYDGIVHYGDGMPDGYLVQAFTMSRGYVTVYHADSYAEAEEIIQLHRDEIQDPYCRFVDRYLSYRIIPF